jgi:hypothetical protein
MDERAGKRLTSLVLKPADTPVEIVRGKGGRPDTITPAFERALKFALETRGETFQPDGGPPVHAVAEEHVRFYFERYWVEGAGTDPKAAKNRRDAFRRTANKWLLEGRLWGQCDDRNRSLIWQPVEDALRPTPKNSF